MFPGQSTLPTWERGGLAVCEDIAGNSTWQRGPEFLRKEFSEWPLTRAGDDFSIPQDEVKKAYVAKITLLPSSSQLIKKQNYKLMMRVIAVIFTMLRGKSFKIKKVPAEMFLEAEKFWLKQAMIKTMQRFEDGKLDSLRPAVRDGVVYAIGRAPPGGVGGPDALPILAEDDPLAVAYIKECHKQGHFGPSHVVMKSRQKYWIVRARKIACRIRNECFMCKILDKKLQEQKMAPLPKFRFQYSRPFNVTALDLCGPFNVKDCVKQKTVIKAWVVVFTCAATRALHLEATLGCKEDDIVQAIRVLKALRGKSKKFISDHGPQLVAAAKDVAEQEWNLDILNSKGKYEWEFVPKEGQHQNGIAESMVKLTKRSIQTVMTDAILTYKEFADMLPQIADIINARPLGVQSVEGDDFLAPITPNHLLHGRADDAVDYDDDEEFVGPEKLTRRARYVARVLDDWWTIWFQTVFPKLVPSYKWLQKCRAVSVGDVCLMKYAGIKKGTYTLGKVIERKVSKDGLVREVKLQYSIRDHTCKNKANPKRVIKTIVRPVQSLVVIVPVDGHDDRDDSGLQNPQEDGQIESDD